jgi:magnesium chelatase family protein
MDRLDVHLPVPAVPVQDLASGKETEPSDKIRTRVTLARRLQTDRYRKERVFNNAQLKPRHLKKYCRIDAEGQNLVERAVSQLGLTARAYGRILRVSRTIADLAESDRIKTIHVAEAIQYRTLDRPVIT